MVNKVPLVKIYKTQDDGSQKVIATCKLIGEAVECVGDEVFVRNLISEGVRDYTREDTVVQLFPKDGIKFLENLQHAFKSGYLIASPVQ